MGEKVTDRMVEISWSHPVHGRIQERLCRRHELEVLRCLRGLGIGCTGEISQFTMGCRRCINTGRRPAFFIRESVR